VAGVGRTGEQQSDARRVAGTGEVVEGERSSPRRGRQGQGLLDAVTGTLGLEDQGEALEPNRATRSKTAKPLQLVEVVPEARGGGKPVTLRVGAVELVRARSFDRDALAGVLDVLQARR